MAPPKNSQQRIGNPIINSYNAWMMETVLVPRDISSDDVAAGSAQQRQQQQRHGQDPEAFERIKQAIPILQDSNVGRFPGFETRERVLSQR